MVMVLGRHRCGYRGGVEAMVMAVVVFVVTGVPSGRA